MVRVRIAYYSVRNGNGFWQPTKAMRALGFQSVPCGRDGPAAWKIAEEWNKRWQAARRGQSVKIPLSAATGHDPDSLIDYPRGSLGEAFRRYRKTDEWARKAPRTREDWWRGWRHICEIFGDVAPHTISLEDMSAWRKHVAEAHGIREAHRALKIWRALWKVSASMRYCTRGEDPSLGVRNTAAAGRSETWTAGEVSRLVKAAWRMNLTGLAAALAVMWDTQMSPGDVRALTAGQLKQAVPAATGGPSLVFAARGKTGVAVGGILSRRASRVVAAYVDSLGFTPMPDQPLFRTRAFVPGAKGGRPRQPVPYSKNVMGQDFRELRESVFGARETRQMIDLRRSGAVEAIAGGANAEQLSHAMGNTLSASNALWTTYVPVNMTSLEAVAKARREGRRKMREKGDGK